MKVIVKDYTDESTDLVYPCLLEHTSSNEVNDIIFAFHSDGDFVVGMVLTNNNQHDHWKVGEVVSRTFLKKHFRPFHGEVVLKNG